MARVRGSIPFSSNYEASISKPMDARMLVPSYDDLLDNTNWLTSKNTPCCFNGMLVAVANTTDTSKNGLYMLFDKENTRRPDVSIDANWIKIGETSDISDFVARIQTIESSITDITADIESLDARVDALETEERVHVYGYRHGFPENGILGHMYVATDEGRTYVFIDSAEGKKYLHIADRIDAEDTDGDPETPEVRVIYGGTAD